jgi:hypothetical protein
MADKKIVDETHKISEKRGNGKLRREIWVDERGHVTKYNLAYINHRIFSGDHGRVIGYDNAHDGHHRHRFGEVFVVKFVSFEDIECQFEADWLTLDRSAE